MERQAIFEREQPPTFIALTSEGALRQLVSGDKIMREQLLKLAAGTSAPIWSSGNSSTSGSSSKHSVLARRPTAS